MVRHCIGFITFLILICAIAGGTAEARPRLALVIGNSQYREVVALPNPEKDANAMADFLAKAGFEVTRANNLTLSEMHRTLHDFADRVAEAGPGADVVMEYDGHGVQIRGENFLIPVDAHITRESDVPLTAIRLTDVMDILSSVPSKNLVVILNACRNNPFAGVGHIPIGLAIADAGRGSIISYATAPGTTALDGEGDHSPFTTALLKVAATPGLPVEQVFKKVRLAVNKATEGQQTPWESSSLTGNFSFVLAQDTADNANEVAQQKPDKPSVASRDEASEQQGARRDASQHETLTVAMWRKKLAEVTPQQAYDLVIEADTVEAYEAFLTVYPKFEYVVRIRTIVDRRLEMIAWYNATIVNDVSAYESFLVHYPDSDLAPTARSLRDRAKNRFFSPDMLANASADPADGAAATKVVTKVVEKPVVVTKVVEKSVVVTKVVEKPVVKVVRQVVRVPSGPCECTDCGRRAGHRIRIIGKGDGGYRVNRPERMRPVQRESFSPRFAGGMRGRRW